MRWPPALLLLCITGFIISSRFFSPPVSATSLTVSVTVGNTQFQAQGTSSPLAQITLKEGSVVIGTTAADALGNWSITVNVPIPGMVTYTAYATSTTGQNSDSLTFSLNIPGNTLTSYTGITIIPPSATPTPTSSTTTSSTSSPSSSSTTPSPSTPSSPSPFPSLRAKGLPAFLAPYLSTGQLRLSSVALVDILRRWIEAWRTNNRALTLQALPRSPRPTPPSSTCDLNRDQSCNLVDLSILLYYIDR